MTQVSRGFSLVELMVTIAMLAVLLTIAIPSFNDFRQRRAIEGAADQIVSFWGDARFEALRRNQLVEVSVSRNATTGAFCLGAAIASGATDNTACNCFLAAPTTPIDDGTFCNISRYPAVGVGQNVSETQREWRRVRYDGTTTIGGGSSVAVLDPKRGSLSESGDAGGLALLSSGDGGINYELNVMIDRNGRAIVCEADDAEDPMPSFSTRQCPGL